MFSKILNTIKLSSQIKRNVTKIRLNNSDMKFVSLLIRLGFIDYIYRPVTKLTKKYDNYYYAKINTSNICKLRNVYRPAAIRTISHRELTKEVLSKKKTYILSTTKGIITHNEAVRSRLSGILVIVIYI